MIINLKTETLLEESRRYVEMVVRQYLDQGLTREQLLEQASKGLERAAETWDEHKQFAVYALKFMHKSILDAIAAVQAGKPIPGENALTTREREIMQSLGEGKSLRLIAEQRGLTEKRLREIIDNINKKIQKQ
jgi:DNA-binding NarL/FixJ family response regulator